MPGGYHEAASPAPLVDAMAPPDVHIVTDAAANAAAERAALRPLQRAEAQEQALRAEATARAKAEAPLDVEPQRMAATQ